jgi:hypothetical protein
MPRRVRRPPSVGVTLALTHVAPVALWLCVLVSSNLCLRCPVKVRQPLSGCAARSHPCLQTCRAVSTRSPTAGLCSVGWSACVSTAVYLQRPHCAALLSPDPALAEHSTRGRARAGQNVCMGGHARARSPTRAGPRASRRAPCADSPRGFARGPPGGSGRAASAEMGGRRRWGNLTAFQTPNAQRVLARGTGGLQRPQFNSGWRPAG